MNASREHPACFGTGADADRRQRTPASSCGGCAHVQLCAALRTARALEALAVVLQQYGDDRMPHGDAFGRRRRS